MSLLQSIIMGLVQGLTEFLPVSSSGHLVLANNLLGMQPDTGILFEVMLHLGTLVSIIIVYNKDIYKMVIEFFVMSRDILKGKGALLKSNPYRVMLVMVLMATIPTGLIGVLFNDLFEQAFSSTQVVSVMLLVTGTLLYIANKLENGVKGPARIRVSDAIVIGLFQGFAITPGISRSGSTIFAGLMRGFSRELATRFSFIMSIPAILGAAVMEFSNYSGAAITSGQLAVMLAGMAVAAVAGTIAIKFLIGLLNKGRLHYFSYYCWFVGLTGLIAGLIIR
ncbi:MAG: undecaprenyl-diphosphate phosphatase [Bacillota bacterium]|nr:undecaprenyl-diphosphate phosphatase [Bacillota bacterium]MDD3850457.1 undecaprenyl-diphosphate phosphatase [Bacillota bacterium]MDD4706795.1 undecaprenyl-diphosphate phosphatase [Bacillota bacterium]